MHPQRFWSCARLFMAVAVVTLVPGRVWAHCDSLEGPVVKQALAVRGKGVDAKALADRFFFETLVRIHRAGEGEAFTGLKPGSDVDPGIAAADEALQSGSASELAKHLSAAVAEGVQKRFGAAVEKKKHVADSVEAGREYVEAYVDYTHFVESVNRLASQGASHLHHEPAAHAE